MTKQRFIMTGEYAIWGTYSPKLNSAFKVNSKLNNFIDARQ